MTSAPLTVIIAEGQGRSVPAPRRRQPPGLVLQSVAIGSEWPEPNAPVARQLSQLLAGVTTPYVYLPPFGFAPLAHGLMEAASLLRRAPSAVSAGGLSLACHDSTGAAANGSNPPQWTWQVALAAVPLPQRRAPPRLRTLGKAYRPFTGYVHRTAVLQDVAAAVAAAKLRDRLSEEMLITFELAARGSFVVVDHAAIAIGPLDRLAAGGLASQIYARFLDQQWFAELSPALRAMAARLTEKDWFDRLGLRDLAHRWVRRAAGSRAVYAMATDLLLRCAFGDALFGLMAGRVTSPAHGQYDLDGLLRRLQQTGWTAAALERLRREIGECCPAGATPLDLRVIDSIPATSDHER